MALTANQIDVIVKLQNLVSDEMKKMTGDTKQFGASLKSTGKQMTMWGAAGTAAITGVMKLTADFNKGLSNVSTLLGDDAMPMMDTYRQGLLKLSTEVPVALGGLNDALYQTVSATGDAEGAMEILTAAADLGVAGLGSTAESVNVVTSALNSFGYKASDTGELANVFFKTVQAGKTDISQLAMGFGQIAPLAAQMGVDFKELMANTAALTTTGMKASVAYTQQKAALASMMKPTKDAKVLLDKLNVETFAGLIERSGGMIEAFRELQSASEGDTEAFAKAMGSVEGLSGVLALMGPVADKAAANLVNMSNGVDTLGGAVDKQTKELSAKVLMLWNNIKGGLIDLGNTLEPTISMMVDSLNWFIDVLRMIPDPILAIGTHIGLLVTAILTIGGPIVAAVGAFLSLQGTLAALGLSIGGIASAITAVMMPAIAAALPVLGVLAAAAYTAYQVFTKWEDIKDLFKYVFTTIISYAQEFLDKVPIYFDMAIQEVIDSIDMLGPRLKKFWYEITFQGEKAEGIETVSQAYKQLEMQVRQVEYKYNDMREEALMAGGASEEHTKAVAGTVKEYVELKAGVSETGKQIGQLTKEAQTFGREATKELSKVAREVQEVTEGVKQQAKEIKQADWTMRTYGSKGWTATASSARKFNKDASDALDNATGKTKGATGATKGLNEEIIRGSDAYQELEDKGRQALIALTDDTFQLKDQVASLEQQLKDMAAETTRAAVDVAKSTAGQVNGAIDTMTRTQMTGYEKIEEFRKQLQAYASKDNDQTRTARQKPTTKQMVDAGWQYQYAGGQGGGQYTRGEERITVAQATMDHLQGGGGSQPTFSEAEDLLPSETSSDRPGGVTSSGRAHRGGSAAGGAYNYLYTDRVGQDFGSDIKDKAEALRLLMIQEKNLLNSLGDAEASTSVHRRQSIMTYEKDIKITREKIRLLQDKDTLQAGANKLQEDLNELNREHSYLEQTFYDSTTERRQEIRLAVVELTAELSKTKAQIKYLQTGVVETGRPGFTSPVEAIESFNPDAIDQESRPGRNNTRGFLDRERRINDAARETAFPSGPFGGGQSLDDLIGRVVDGADSPADIARAVEDLQTRSGAGAAPINLTVNNNKTETTYNRSPIITSDRRAQEQIARVQEQKSSPPGRGKAWDDMMRNWSG